MYYLLIILRLLSQMTSLTVLTLKLESINQSGSKGSRKKFFFLSGPATLALPLGLWAVETLKKKKKNKKK